MTKHSKRFEKVKNYYDGGNWDIRKVHEAVGKWITADEYQEITGMDYDNGKEGTE